MCGFFAKERTEFNGVLATNRLPAPFRSHLGGRPLTAFAVRSNCLPASLEFFRHLTLPARAAVYSIIAYPS